VNVATVEGLAPLLDRLKNVEKKLKTKILKDGVGAGGKVVLTGAKSRVRVDTNLLKKSLARKVKSYKGGAVTVAVVGPRSSFKMKKVKDAAGVVSKVRTETGFGKKVSRGGRKEVYAQPSKYSHLVEKGTRRSRAFPFLGISGESPDVATAVVEKIAEGIEAAGNGG
jgi:hypothetical protein